jgi:hypothetical protein
VLGPASLLLDGGRLGRRSGREVRRGRRAAGQGGGAALPNAAKEEREGIGSGGASLLLDGGRLGRRSGREARRGRRAAGHGGGAAPPKASTAASSHRCRVHLPSLGRAFSAAVAAASKRPNRTQEAAAGQNRGWADRLARSRRLPGLLLRGRRSATSCTSSGDGDAMNSVSCRPPMRRAAAERGRSRKGRWRQRRRRGGGRRRRGAGDGEWLGL